MILAFSPAQAIEVAKAFDADWWTSEELNQQGQADKENTDKKQEGAKPAAKKAHPKTCHPNQRCHPNKNNKNVGTLRPCHAYNRAARLARQANNHKLATKTIEQRSPIHMHEETPQFARMSLDVAGFTPNDISINVDNHVVSIRGQRTNKLGDVFELDRKFRLDKNTVNVDGVAASFDDGILEVTVPKKPIAGPRKIQIAVASSAASDDTKASDDSSASHNEDKEETTTDSDSVNEQDEAVLELEEESPPEADEEQEHVPITVEDQAKQEPAEDKEVETRTIVPDEAWEEVSN